MSQLKAELKHWLKERHIIDVECIIADITGTARGKIIPSAKFSDENPRLPEGTLLQDIRGDFCDEYLDLVDPEDKDMQLIADENTIRTVPWMEKPTAQIIHDCFTMDGQLHPLSSRNVLRRVLDQYKELDIKAVIAPEVEFYLLEKNTDVTQELKPPTGRTGRTETIRQPYGIDTMYEYQAVIDTLYEYCDAQQLKIDTLVHEFGPAQMEINFLHGDPMDMADQVFTFKRTLREAAFKHGIYATFMAKPLASEPGSSMHIHQSLVDSKSGKNLFADSEGNKTPVFYHYLGGLQKFTNHVMSFYAPNVNSYRRFTKELGAPTNLHWGFDNRTVGLRVPNATVAATRIENRFAGIDTNPYLAIAASLACGLAGIKNKISPDDAFEGCAYDEENNLVSSFSDALKQLKHHNEVTKILGEEFVHAYHCVKQEELNQFNKIVTPWERKYLLSGV